jgi:hypothetical protein
VQAQLLRGTFGVLDERPDNRRQANGHHSLKIIRR